MPVLAVKDLLEWFGLNLVFLRLHVVFGPPLVLLPPEDLFPEVPKAFQPASVRQSLGEARKGGG